MTHGYCNCNTCHHCGAPVFRTKRQTYNVDPKHGLLHRQSCTNKPAITAGQSVEDVKRQHRL